MKTNRYILSLLLLVVSVFNLTPANAQQNQYAIYNYRNDGDFNAWLNIDVEKITYSCIDTLGVEHDDVVVQEVWTPDSVYRIPINAIDSIGFRAPKPVMREGLFYLREYHASHTVGIDSLTLYFDMGIRNDSLPAIGQVVLNGTYNSPYEEGFAGKVLSIKKEQGKIIIVCENAEIYDIFKKLIIVGKSSNDLDSISNAQRIRRKSIKIEETDVIENIKVPDLEMSVLDGIFKVKSKAPKVTCGYFVYVDELIYSISADAYIRHNDLSFEVAFKYGQMADAISDIKEHLLGQIESDYSRSTLEKYLKEGVTIPLKKGVINISLKLAPQIKIDGDLELDFVTKTSAKQHIGFKAKGYTAAVIARLYNPFFSLIPFSALGSITKWDYSYVQNPAKSTSLSAKATGSAKAGFLVQLEANLIHKNVVHASVGVEAGRKLSGTLQFNIRDSENPDMNFYDIIKDTNVDLKSYAKIKGGIGASPIDFWTLKGEIDLYDDVLGKYYIVPHFTKPELPVYQNNSWNNYHPMSFYSTISKDILFTCKPGMRIVDEQGNIIKEVNTTDEYKYEVEWRYRPLEMDISDLEANKTYRCYPTFCFWGSTYFKAGPYKEFTIPHPVSFETDKISLQIGKSQSVAINGGWGDYSLGHLNKTACDAELKKEGDNYYIQLLGKAKGLAPITINDLRSGESTTLIVDVVEEAIDLALSETTVSMKPNETAEVAITSGSGSYTVANSNAEVAVAAISNGNKVAIAALKAGTATITVTDTKTQQTAEIAVTITTDTSNVPAEITKVELTGARYFRDEEYPNRMYYTVTAQLNNLTDIEEWGIFYKLNDGSKYGFKFEEVAREQSKGMMKSRGTEGWTYFDLDSYVAQLDDSVGIYVKRCDKISGDTLTYYSSMYNYTLRYDKKPSFTFTNPIITGTEVIETDDDGNKRYKTSYSYQYSLEGALWIDYIDDGISSGWEHNGEPWYPTGDVVERTVNSSAKYWGGGGYSRWKNLHLRNGQTITSNYLNLSIDETVTEIWVSPSPYYNSPSMLPPTEPIEEGALRNIVEVEMPIDYEKKMIHKDVERKEYRYKGGIISTY